MTECYSILFYSILDNTIYIILSCYIVYIIFNYTNFNATILYYTIYMYYIILYYIILCDFISFYLYFVIFSFFYEEYKNLTDTVHLHILVLVEYRSSRFLHFHNLHYMLVI